MSKSETTDRHANARDRKRANGRKMVVTNRGIFVLDAMKGKRAAETPHAFTGTARTCSRCQAPRRAAIHDKAA